MAPPLRMLPPLIALLAPLLLPPGAAGGGLGAALESSILDDLPAGALDSLQSGGCLPACPAGTFATPRLPVQAHRPSANGCGPQSGGAEWCGEERCEKGTAGDGSYQVKEPYGLVACCNAHDLCFQTCGLTFQTCEDRFESCTGSVCAALPTSAARAGCSEQAATFSRLTREFGCSFHRSSVLGDEGWEPVCDCTAVAAVPERVGMWLREFWADYRLADPPPAAPQDPDEAAALLWNVVRAFFPAPNHPPPKHPPNPTPSCRSSSPPVLLTNPCADRRQSTTSSTLSSSRTCSRRRWSSSISLRNRRPTQGPDDPSNDRRTRSERVATSLGHAGQRLAPAPLAESSRQA